MREFSKEELRERPTLRCLECFQRIEVLPKAKRLKCPNCGSEYFIYWPNPNVAKIKGPAT